MSLHRPGPFLLRPARLLIPALAGLVLPACETRIPAPPPPERFSGLERLELERVENRYLDLLWSLHPSLALWAGAPGREAPRLRATRPEIFAARREARNLLDQALAVRSDGLPPSARRDQKVLAGDLRGLLVELEKVEPWARDPGYYLDEIQALLALADNLYSNPTSRGEALRLQLLSIPRLLPETEENLRFCPPPFLDAAARRARSLSALLRSGRAFPRGMEAGLARELKAAAEKAGLALEAWAVRLEQRKKEKPGGSFVLGEDTLAALLREREGIFTPPREWIPDLKAREKTLASSLARRLGEPPSAAALEALAAKALPPPREEEALSVGPPWARRRCGKEGLLPAALPTHEVPPLRPPFPAALDLPVWPPLEGDPSRISARLLLDLARATWPGLQALRSWLAGNASPLRRAAPSPLFCRGWLSYAEDLWAEKSPHEEVRTLRAWRRLVECVQARAALELHAGELTLSQAEALLRDRAFLPSARAEELALELARVPLRHLGFLGLQAIDELRSACRTREGRAFAAGVFHGKLLSCGALPAGALEAELLLSCQSPSAASPRR